MAIINNATTTWTGSLFDGSGHTRLDSSAAADLAVNWKARSEGSDSTTTPEELLAAAHAACYSMAFSHALTEASFPPERIQTTASVSFTPGAGITGIHLVVDANVNNISDAEFQAFADTAKTGCPISGALRTPITLDATLSS